jgi:hypothetical protein
MTIAWTFCGFARASPKANDTQSALVAIRATGKTLARDRWQQHTFASNMPDAVGSTAISADENSSA